VTRIYCFSGTGNSLWSAKKIAEKIGGESEIVNVGAKAQWRGAIVEADAAVLVFPSYAFGPPPAVKRFAQGAVFKTPYLAAFVTYGSTPGGTLAALSRVLRRKRPGERPGAFFFGRIPAVENYIAIFGPPKAKTAARRLAMQARATEEAARAVVERRERGANGFRPFSAFAWTLFSLGLKVFYRRYRVSADCDGCAICEKVCPVGAVSMRDGRPRFSAKCEHCQGCLNWCPKRAIWFGRLNAGLARYHHPEIDWRDMRDPNRAATSRGLESAKQTQEA